MATRTYRNLTDDELWVPSVQRLVKPDEVIEVEDDKNVVWPESVWGLVGKAKSTTKSGE